MYYLKMDGNYFLCCSTGPLGHRKKIKIVANVVGVNVSDRWEMVFHKELLVKSLVKN